MRISDWSSDVCSSDLKSAAQVDFISPVLDEATGLVTAIAIIDNRAGQWRVGEPVTASIRLRGANAGSILVPHGAIQTIKGRPTVFVRTDHGFKATPIVLGPQSGDHVVVTSGLRGEIGRAHV